MRAAISVENVVSLVKIPLNTPFMVTPSPNSAAGSSFAQSVSYG